MVAPQRPFTNYNPINISKTHALNGISLRLTKLYINTKLNSNLYFQKFIKISDIL